VAVIPADGPSGAVAERPTLASTWHAISGGAFTDELLTWPPDVFALTNVLLDRSEAFRTSCRPATSGRTRGRSTSQQLGSAIASLEELMQAAGPTFDAVLAAAREDRSGEQAIDELVRAVLRSTLEQLCSRQASRATRPEP
jgi:hypothetical protein